MVEDKSVDVGVLHESPEGRPAFRDGAIDDPEMDGLTLYEKKALLINREFNSQGMGKYQWYGRFQAFTRILEAYRSRKVHILFVWVWLLHRFTICTSVWTGGASAAE